jgi:hypothetical protein
VLPSRVDRWRAAQQSMYSKGVIRSRGPNRAWLPPAAMAECDQLSARSLSRKLRESNHVTPRCCKFIEPTASAESMTARPDTPRSAGSLESTVPQFQLVVFMAIRRRVAFDPVCTPLHDRRYSNSLMSGVSSAFEEPRGGALVSEPDRSQWIRSPGCRGTQQRKNALMTLQEGILRSAGDAVGAGPG